MRAKGIYIRQSHSRGDQLVVVRVETPINLNRQQKELLEEFARISGESTQPMSKSFFDKVKDILS